MIKLVTTLAGQSFDLQDAPENIVLYLIRDKWNHEQDGLIPSRESISFSLFGWNGRKSYQISIEPSTAPAVQHMNIGGSNTYLRYLDPILVHVWLIKNRDEVPPQLHHITQRVEQIILENVTNVGYGISSIQLRTPFSAIEQLTIFGNQTEVSLWHSTATVELLYFRVTTGIVSGLRSVKTHKYDIEIEE